jgi:hypothetical protein
VLEHEARDGGIELGGHVGDRRRGDLLGGRYRLA